MIPNWTLLVSALCLPFSGRAQAQCQQAKLLANDTADHDIFGASVGISGNITVVGAPLEDNAAGDGAGSVYVYSRAGGWPQVSKLLGHGVASGDLFGSEVAIDGNTLIAAAMFGTVDEQHVGAVYVFRFTGFSWIQEAQLSALGKGTGIGFGFSVDVDGDTVVCGAPADFSRGVRTGSVYVYQRVEGRWLKQARIVPFDGSDSDEFGSAVDLDGDVLVVGARLDDDSGTDSGSAYVYRRTGSDWRREDKIQAMEGQAGDWFGESVSISGDALMVGAPYSGLNDDGAAYVFRRRDFAWWQEARLQDQPVESNAYFGNSVAIQGPRAAVGAPQDLGPGGRTGAVFCYELEGAIWVLREEIHATDGALGDWLGASVALGDDEIVAGAAQKNGPGGAEAGAAYVFSTESTRSYCTAKVNSEGCLPSIGSIGSPTLGGADDFVVTARDVINNSLGVMLWSLEPDSTPFAGGVRCVGEPLHRTPGAVSGGNPPPRDCSGAYAFHFSHAIMSQQGWTPGQRIYAQFVSRDPGYAAPSNVGLTDALRFTICP